MYPFIRMLKEVQKAKRQPRLNLGEIHSSDHLCLPWDLDLWAELNNGRTLTLYDLGRVPLTIRSGILDIMKKHGWGMTMAGAFVRYRRRIRLFEKFTMRSRFIHADHRFFYIEQSMWHPSGECANHIVYRAAYVDDKGILAPAKIIEALGAEWPNSQAPKWLQTWIEAENLRPWPPMQ